MKCLIDKNQDLYDKKDLINDDNTKNSDSKLIDDDISSLKIINDVMKGKSENEQTEINYNEYEQLSSDKLSKIHEIINEK